MKKAKSLQAGLLAACLVGLFAGAPAFAEKPDWAGNGKGQARDRDERHDDRNDRRDHRDDRRDHRDDRHDHRDDRRDHRDNVRYEHDDRRARPVSVDIHFHDRQRTVIREYYHRELSGGRCPPGLAKKHNGCMPPGQAKKWQRGRVLTRDVVYYDLPPALVVELGTPPRGYKYVRVASDILMIAIGTSMVVDAIEDLSRM